MQVKDKKQNIWLRGDSIFWEENIINLLIHNKREDYTLYLYVLNILFLALGGEIA